MAKNTRRGASRSPAKKKNTQRQVPGWVWLFTGLMVGLFGAFLFHLGKTQLQQGGQQTASKPQPKVETPTPKKDEPKSSDDSPQFDFYAVLPKMEVIVPKGEDDPQPSRRTPPADAGTDGATEVAVADRQEQYLLQAGSFRRNDDADRRRGELILHGLTARIQPVSMGNGDTWYRVMVGPFDNANAAHRAQDKLASAGIETLAIRAKKD